MNAILMNAAIQVEQVANGTPSKLLWIFGGIAILLGLLCLLVEEFGMFWLLLIGGAVPIVIFFVSMNGTHLDTPIKHIEKQYDVTVMNSHQLVRDIESADEFTPIEFSYKADGSLYQENVYILKEEKRNRHSELQSYSFEIFSNLEKDKVEVIPFKSCTTELCPDGIRKFD